MTRKIDFRLRGYYGSEHLCMQGDFSPFIDFYRGISAYFLKSAQARFVLDDWRFLEGGQESLTLFKVDQ